MYNVGYTALLISLFKLVYAINNNLLMLFSRSIQGRIQDLKGGVLYEYI